MPFSLKRTAKAKLVFCAAAWMFSCAGIIGIAVFLLSRLPEKLYLGQKDDDSILAPNALGVSGKLTLSDVRSSDYLEWCSPSRIIATKADPVFKLFGEWVATYKDGGRVDEGVALAKERRVLLKRLIGSDPESALALAVPEADRRNLPESVVCHLGEWVSEFVDVQAIHHCFDPARLTGMIMRTVELSDGRQLNAYVYGQRNGLSSRKGIAVWGIAIDDIFAIADQPTRRVGKGELLKPDFPDNFAVELAGNIYEFPSEEGALVFERRVRDAEGRDLRRPVRYPVIAGSSGSTNLIDRKYELITTPVNWSQAQSMANAQGGRLVCIGSAWENSIVLKLLRDAKTMGFLPEFNGTVAYSWIGATDNEAINGSRFDRDLNATVVTAINASEGNWSQLDGTRLVGTGTYSNWLAGEPNSTDPNEEDFAAMDWSDAGGGKWCDLNGSYSLPFLIEYELDFEAGLNAVPVNANRKVLLFPARFRDEGFGFTGNSAPVVDGDGNIINPELQQDTFEPDTAENIRKQMASVKTFYERNSDNTFHLDYVLAGTVTMDLPKWERHDKFDSSTSGVGSEEISYDGKEIGVLGMEAKQLAAEASPDWDYDGPAFEGVLEVSIANGKEGMGYKRPPVIRFEGGQYETAGIFRSSFRSAQAKAILDEAGAITGIAITDSGAYYEAGADIRVVVEGEATAEADPNQFTVTLGRTIVSWVAITTWGTGGLGVVGGAGSHVTSKVSAGVIAHELGHNFGLWHANRYIPEGEKAISDEGSNLDYGNPYSLMGGGGIAGDFTMPGKVALRQQGNFGLTLGAAPGSDVTSLLDRQDLTDSQFNEGNNTFRIYRHDYGSAPYPLLLSTFDVNLTDVEKMPPEFTEAPEDQFWPILIGGPGTEANGSFIKVSDGLFKLNLTKPGRGFSEEPSIEVVDANNSLIMQLDPNWIQAKAGTENYQRAFLRNLSHDANKSLRGIELPASQYAPDGPDAGLPMGSYWISYRKDAESSGLCVINGTPSGIGTVENALLDLSQATPGDFSDAFLYFGQTFSDYESDIHVTPLIGGGTYPMEYIEVVVNLGTVEEGSAKAPKFSLFVSDRRPAAGESVEFTVVFPDGVNASEYSCSWYHEEIAETSVSFLNKKSIHKAFPTSGNHNFKVMVSDMKGGVSSETVVLAVGEPEIRGLSRISGRVGSPKGSLQGARVVLQKAPIIEHDVEVVGSLVDSRVPSGMANSVRFMVDGLEQPRLQFKRGEVHRFSFGPSSDGFPLTFFSGSDHEPARVKLKPLASLLVETNGSGYAKPPAVTLGRETLFGTYRDHEVGTIEDFQKGLLGNPDLPILIREPLAKTLLVDTKVRSVAISPVEFDKDSGTYVVMGGKGHHRDFPPKATIQRQSLWENYMTDANATATAYVDGVGSVFVGSKGRGYGDALSIAIVGRGWDANATGILNAKTPFPKQLDSVDIVNQGYGYDPNATLAAAHYPESPYAHWSFDRYESLYDSNNTPFDPLPGWGLDNSYMLKANWNFDEENSTTIADSSIYTDQKGILTLVGSSPAERSHWGAWGRAVELNGTAAVPEYFEPDAPVGPVGFLTDSFSVSLWVKVDNNTTAEHGFASQLGGGGDVFSLWWDGQLRAKLHDTEDSPDPSDSHTGSSKDVLLSGPHLEKGKWTHLGLILDKDTNSTALFVQGELVDSYSYSSIKNVGSRSSTFRLGEAENSSGTKIYLNGKLDATHIYDRALEDWDIRRLAGNLFLDMSGNRLHAIPVGTPMDDPDLDPAIVDGPPDLGDALDMNGSQRVDLRNVVRQFSALATGSISFWIKTSGLRPELGIPGPGKPSDMTILSASSTSDAQSYFRLMLRDIGSVQLLVMNDDAEITRFYTDQNSRITPPDGNPTPEWHHVVLLVDEVSSSFYVDGKAATSLTATDAGGGGDPPRAFFSDVENVDYMAIGRHQTSEANATDSFIGTLDEFYIYDRILTTKEISFLYALGSDDEVKRAKLEAEVDAVGTVLINEKGAGYKEVPVVTFSFGSKYEKGLDVNETIPPNPIEGDLWFDKDNGMIKYYIERHHSSVLPLSEWKTYVQAVGYANLKPTSVDKILFTKDVGKQVEVTLPNGETVLRRFLEYVTEAPVGSTELYKPYPPAGTPAYAPPEGLFGYIAPPIVEIDSSGIEHTDATGFALYFLNPEKSVEIQNPGIGYNPAGGFTPAAVRIRGSGLRPPEFEAVMEGQSVGVLSLRKHGEGPYSAGKARVYFLGEGGENSPTLSNGWLVSNNVRRNHLDASGDLKQTTGILLDKKGSDWKDPPTVYLDWDSPRDVSAQTLEFNSTLGWVNVDDSGMGYSVPAKVALHGGRPDPDWLTGYVADNNDSYSFRRAVAKIKEIDANGSILTFEVTDSGAGYVRAPFVAITGGGGMGATATALLNPATGEVASVLIDPGGGGRGYYNFQDENNTPLASLEQFALPQQDADIKLRLGGGLEKIKGGNSHYFIAPWVEITDLEREMGEIAENDQAKAFAKVVDGKISKVIVEKSGRGYINPRIKIYGAPPRFAMYDRSGAKGRWLCTNLRETESGEFASCGHIHKSEFAPETCPGEYPPNNPLDVTQHSAWWKTHKSSSSHDCQTQGNHYNGSFKSRKCAGTKESFVLMDSYRTPVEIWAPYEANCSAIVKDGKIMEIIVDKPGDMYYFPEIAVTGSGGEVAIVPILDESGRLEQVIYDDPLLINLETSPWYSLNDDGKTWDLTGRPEGSGQGFVERPWTLDYKHDAKFGPTERVFATLVPMESQKEGGEWIWIPDNLTGLTSPTLGDAWGDRVKDIEVLGRGVYLDDTIPTISIDFNGTHRHDFIAAKASSQMTTGLTKFVLDGNGTWIETVIHEWIDDNGTLHEIEKLFTRSTFLDDPKVEILNLLGGTQYSFFEDENSTDYIRLNGAIDYDFREERGYIDVVVDDRFPNKLFYGLGESDRRSMGGEIMIMDGMPAMNWGLDRKWDAIAYTDSNGFYSITGLSPGVYNVGVLIEDTALQELTFRPDVAPTTVSRVLYVPGMPELTMVTDQRGAGKSSLVWAKAAKKLSVPIASMSETLEHADEDKILTGIGLGFKQGDKPLLRILPDPSNSGRAAPRVSTEVLVDGSLQLTIVDDVNSTTHNPDDRFTVSYASTISGVDFTEDFLYEQIDDAYWMGRKSAADDPGPRLIISPSDGNNSVEIPISSSLAGERPFAFSAKAYDLNGSLLDTDAVSWELEFDINSTEGNFSKLASLSATDGNITALNLYSTLRQGQIVGFRVDAGGSGYLDGNSTKVEVLGDGTGAVGHVTTVDVNGAILDLNVTGGSDYTVATGVRLIRPENQVGTDASLTAIVGGHLYLKATLGALVSKVRLEVSHRAQLTNKEIWANLHFDTVREDFVGWNDDNDNDGLLNSEEFSYRTNPWKADTDGDGLFDRNETARVSGGIPAPTDPNNPDSDGDGLLDGVESNTGIFVDANNTGSDPLNYDTDGDEWPDGLELAYGLDPNMDLQSGGASVASISGTIYFPGELNGTLYVTVRPKEMLFGVGSKVSEVVYKTYSPSKATYYYFPNLLTGVTYEVLAFIDRSANQYQEYQPEEIDEGEPIGIYSGSWTGALSQSRSKVNVTLVDQPPVISFDEESLRVIYLEEGNVTNITALAYDLGDQEYKEIWIDGNATTDPKIDIRILPPAGDELSAKVFACSVSPLGGALPGVYHLNLKSKDISETQQMETITIVIKDRQPPTITLLGANPLELEAGSTFEDPGAWAIDNVDGNITNDLTVSGTVGTLPDSYDLTYVASDEAGNQNTITRTVNIVDTTSPVILINGDSNTTLEFGSVWVDPGYSATDWNGSLTESIVATTLENAQELPPGHYSVTYNVSDFYGNNATQVVRAINIVDKQAPAITLIGDNPFLHEAGTKFTEPGYTALDNVDGNLTSLVGVAGTVGSGGGVYDLEYSISDESGNMVKATRKVHVVDSTPPVLTLFGGSAVDHEKGQAYVDSGYIAIDSVDGDLKDSVLVTGYGFDENIPGSYRLSYTVEDSSGNTATAERTVNVKDWVFTLNGKALDGYLINAAVVFDVDGDGLHDLSTSVFTDENGAYALTFSQKEFSELDTNKNGLIDHDEGRISVSGGFDSSTLNPFTGTFEADANSTVVTPLTTLATALMDLDSGLSREQAFGTISEAMGIPATINLSTYDPISSASAGEGDARSALVAGARVANVIRQATALMNYASNGEDDGKAFASQVLKEIAQKIESGGKIPLGGVDEMQTVLSSAMTSSAYSTLISEADLAGVSQMMVVADELIEESSVANPQPQELGSDLAMIQAAVEESVVSGYDRTHFEGGTPSSLSSSLSKEFLSGQKSTYLGVNLFPPTAANANVALAHDLLEANATVYSISASDPDSDKVQFTFAGGNPDADSDGNLAFSISEEGLVRVNDADELATLSSSDVTKLEVRMADGEGLFGIVSISVQLDNPLAFESNAVAGLANWKNSTWLGNFYSNGRSWVYHESLGWLYVLSDQSGGFWIWDVAQQSWWWTKEGAFPYFYMYENVQGKWGKWDFSTTPILRYDFSGSKWIERLQ
jgi:hypothetical protein